MYIYVQTHTHIYREREGEREAEEDNLVICHGKAYSSLNMPSLNISLFNISDYTQIDNLHVITYLYTLQFDHTLFRLIWARVCDLHFTHVAFKHSKHRDQMQQTVLRHCTYCLTKKDQGLSYQHQDLRSMLQGLGIRC